MLQFKHVPLSTRVCIEGNDAHSILESLKKYNGSTLIGKVLKNCRPCGRISVLHSEMHEYLGLLAHALIEEQE